MLTHPEDNNGLCCTRRCGHETQPSRMACPSCGGCRPKKLPLTSALTTQQRRVLQHAHCVCPDVTETRTRLLQPPTLAYWPGSALPPQAHPRHRRPAPPLARRPPPPSATSLPNSPADPPPPRTTSPPSSHTLPPPTHPLPPLVPGATRRR